MRVHPDKTLIWIHQVQALHTAPPCWNRLILPNLINSPDGYDKLDVSVKPETCMRPQKVTSWTLSFTTREMVLTVCRGVWISLLNKRRRNDQNVFLCSEVSDLQFQHGFKKKKNTIRINLRLPSIHLESSYKTQRVAVYIRAHLEKATSMARQLGEVKWQHSSLCSDLIAAVKGTCLVDREFKCSAAAKKKTPKNQGKLIKQTWAKLESNILDCSPI